MSARIITIAQQKGGAGKTTLAAHLAVAFATDGRRVAMIDVDPQASLAQWFQARNGNRSAGPVPPLSLSAIPGWKLGTEIDRLQRTSDVILIDSPPHAETEARIAVRSAHLALVPLQPSPMDLWATGPTITLARTHNIPILIVLNRVAARSRVVEITRKRLGEQDLPVARTAIANRITFASSMLDGRSVLEQAPRSMAASEIRTLAEEIDIRLHTAA
ncbi:MAG: ParA family protein [Defluviicoccus sp.]|nr:MAG: ParA family protein [Defluviicoccus sp.]